MQSLGRQQMCEFSGRWALLYELNRFALSLLRSSKLASRLLDMALGLVLTVPSGLSSCGIGRLVVRENLRFVAEQVSCSHGCASRSQTFVKSPGSFGWGRDLPRRSCRTRDQFSVSAAADENKDAGGGDGGSSERDVEALESRLGLGRRARREGTEPKPRPPPPSQPKREKKWEEMSLAEQALSFYIGEKGLLFWLNKLAYASIFIVIGGWIVFRFVGPSLGWYELDSPLLSPNELLG